MSTVNPNTQSPFIPATNRRWRWIIIGLLIAGIVLSVWVPIWLLPDAGNTIILYIPIYFLWVIVLIIARLTHRLRFRLAGWIGVVGLVILEVLLGYVLIILFALSVQSEPTCTQVASGIITIYTCQVKAIFAAIDCAPSISHYQFVGVGNFPVVLKTKDDVEMGACY